MVVVLGVASGASGANSARIDVQLPVAYSISGTIRDSGGAGLFGAYVVVSAGTFERVDSTDAGGKYLIVGLNPGSYLVQVIAPSSKNLVDGYYTTANTRHHTVSKESASKVTVGPSRAGIDIKLPTGYTISGTISTTAGAGLEASVYANGTTSDMFDTDATGKYTLRGLSGKVTLGVWPNSGSDRMRGFYTSANTNHFTTASSSATTISLTSSRTGVNIKVPNGYTISGTVTDASGVPIPDAAMQAVSATYETRAFGTDAQGKYILHGLAPGSYRVAVTFGDSDGAGTKYMSGYYTSSNANHFTSQSAGATVVSVGPSRSGVNLKVATGYTISGTVTTTDGSPVAGARLTAHGPYLRTSTTDTAGRYVVRGLATASWTLQLRAPDGNLMSGYYTSANGNRFTSAPTGATSMTTGPSITGRNIRVPIGNKIFGTITLAGGAPAWGAYVRVSKAGYESTAYTDSEGSYMVDDLGSGTYTIEITAPSNENNQSGYYRSSATGHFTASKASASGVLVGP